MSSQRPPMEVHSAPNVPAWRAELSARVRQIKARRSMEAELEAAIQEQQKLAALVAQPNVITVTAEPIVVAPVPEPPPPAAEVLKFEEIHTDEKSENPIVKAMLDRVRRASEHSRSVEAPVSQKPRSAGIHRMAATTQPILTTATAPATLLSPVSEPAMPDVSLHAVPSPSVVAEPVQSPVSQLSEGQSLSAFVGSESFLGVPETDEFAFSELDAELDAVFTASGEAVRPEIVERLRAGAIDVATILVSNVPLWIAVQAVGAEFSDARVAVLLTVAGILIAGVYLFGTMAVAGQTFGMQFGGLCVVCTQTRQIPTLKQAFLRAIGYVASFFTLMIGFVWAIFDPNQRGLHEHLSGTQLIRVGK